MKFESKKKNRKHFLLASYLTFRITNKLICITSEIIRISNRIIRMKNRKIRIAIWSRALKPDWNWEWAILVHWYFFYWYWYFEGSAIDWCCISFFCCCSYVDWMISYQAYLPFYGFRLLFLTIYIFTKILLFENLAKKYNFQTSKIYQFYPCHSN